MALNVIVQIWWTRPPDYRTENAHLTPRRGDIVSVVRDDGVSWEMPSALRPRFAWLRVQNCPERGQGPATNLRRITRAILGDQASSERKYGNRFIAGNLRRAMFRTLRDDGVLTIEWRLPQDDRCFQPNLRRLNVVNDMLPDLDDTSTPVRDDDV